MDSQPPDVPPTDLDPSVLESRGHRLENADLEHAGRVRRERRELYQHVESRLLKVVPYIVVIGTALAILVAASLFVELLTPFGQDGWLNETQLTALQTAALGLKEAAGGGALLFLLGSRARRYYRDRYRDQPMDTN